MPPDTDFSTVLTSYKSLDLPSLQSLLASLVEPLTAHQTNSLTSRKKLAEQTREFKKLKDEEKLESYKPLLKAYQVEIDDLTRRSRDAESGVRRVEEKLRGLADPYVILEKVLDQMASATEAEKAREENARLQDENQRLQEKLDDASALQADRDRLAERLASFETELAQAKSDVQVEVTARFDERLANATAREEQLSRSLTLAQEQLKQLRTSHETTTERLLSSTSTSASRPAAAELEMLSQDLQRANERIATVERRNEQLREQVEQVKTGRAELATIDKLQNKLRIADEERARIQAHLTTEEESRKSDALAHRDALAKLQVQIQQRASEIDALEAKLKAQSDYEEIKRELGILRYVEFSNGLDDEDEDDEDDNLGGSAPASSSAKPLETLLIGKNKKLQDELTALRVAHNELTQQSSSSLQQQQKLKGEADRLAKLVEKLENDLLEIGTGSSPSANANANGTHLRPSSARVGAGAAPMSAEEALDELDRIGKGGGDDAVVSAPAVSSSAAAAAKSATNGGDAAAPAPAASPRASTSTSTPTPTPTSATNADSSVLPIIVSQRDRFRSRNAELEEELRKQFELITSLRTEIKTLQTDNLALYEKVRYLQSYASSSSSSSQTSASAPAHVSRFAAPAAARNEYPPASRHTKVPMNIASGSSTAAADNDDDKYRAKYEQSMNPFEAFRGREQSRAMSSLNPLERLLHMMSSVILSDRRMRIGFMVYAVGMHLFIFGILLDYTFFGTGGAVAGGGTVVPGTGCAAPLEPATRR